ncbi:MAG: hypothetical protein LAT68_13400 [Cyclobacteriaceae bacterium]|nr:hypothetical protein [Cyclobacteriaceae bacterium]MCH8517316.1 hypothetical protein [Cyclobacteriaceae bacterium]
MRTQSALLILMITCLLGCSSSKQGAEQNYEQYCHIERYPSSIDRIEPIARFSEVERHFDKRSRRVIRSLRLDKNIDRLLTLKSADDPISFEIERQKIHSKVQMASLVLSGLAASFDCEEERAEAVAGMMIKKENQLLRKVTISSIVIGGIVAITAGTLFISGYELAAELIGISGGLAEAGLGTFVLLSRHEVKFMHQENLLHPLYYKTNEAAYFPPFVWNYINQSSQENDIKLIDQLNETWLEYAPSDEEKKTEWEATLFGRGGSYNATLLELRADMLDQAESVFTQLKQELGFFLRELDELER